MSNDALREALANLVACHDDNIRIGFVDPVRAAEAWVAARAALPQSEAQPSVSGEPHDEWAAFLTWRDDYSRHSDPCAWPAWQARAALNPPPPSAPYVPLSDMEISDAYVAWDKTPGTSWADFARAIERIVVERVTHQAPNLNPGETP